MKKTVIFVLTITFLCNAFSVSAFAENNEELFNNRFKEDFIKAFSYSDDRIPYVPVNYYNELYYREGEWALLFAETYKYTDVPVYLTLGDKTIYESYTSYPFVLGYGLYDVEEGQFYDIKDVWNSDKYPGMQEAFYKAHLEYEAELPGIVAREELKNLLDKYEGLYYGIESIDTFRFVEGAVDKLISGYEAVANSYGTRTKRDDNKGYNCLVDAIQKMYLSKDYVDFTYEYALKERNYNNWYNEEDWSTFVSKRDKLGEAMESGDEKLISDSFDELIDFFDLMVNRNPVSGDVDCDGKLTVNDVTLVQKYVSGMTQFTYAQANLAKKYSERTVMYSCYDEINIKTATTLQKVIAGITEDIKEIPDFFLDEDIFGHKYNYLICETFTTLDERTGSYQGGFLGDLS